MNKGKGELIGKLENLFGPNVVEILEETLSDYSALRDYPQWKEMVVSMIVDPGAEVSSSSGATNGKGIKEFARECLDKTQLDIYTPRGWGYSDEQLNELRRTGINPTKPAYK